MESGGDVNAHNVAILGAAVGSDAGSGIASVAMAAGAGLGAVVDLGVASLTAISELLFSVQGVSLNEKLGEDARECECSQ